MTPGPRASTRARTSPKGGEAATAASKGRKNPDVRSKSVLVIDPADSSIVFERQADLVAPIASITKLMTSLVVLDAKLPLDEMLELTKDDRSKNGKGAFSRLTSIHIIRRFLAGASSTRFRSGTTLRRKVRLIQVTS